jgi:surface protein
MLTGSGISRQNYDTTLIGWSGKPQTAGVLFDASSTVYCSGVSARQYLITNYGWTIADAGEDCTFSEDDAFITTWKTDNPGSSDGDQVTISTTGSGYNYIIDWGDGNVDTGNTGAATHTYASPGIYTIKINGAFPRFTVGGDAQKLLSVEQWGDIVWTSMAYAFDGASNVQILASDAPDLSNVTSLDSMFRSATSFNSDISHWDVSTITDMYGVFAGASSFNQSLNDWDVSNVTTMFRMFNGATSFNSDISQWNTGRVQNMRDMFSSAAAFNQPLNSWDVSSVTTMNAMFYRASAFNQSLNNWDVSSVTDMSYMFEGAQDFNGSLAGWTTNSLANTRRMFFEAASFNQPIDHFNMSNVTTTRAMFYDATNFNQPLNSWNVGNVTDMDDMFLWADSFNQSLNNWNTGSVVWAQRMFYGATSFNQSLGSWDIGNLLYASIMLVDSAQSPSNYDATLIGWSAQALQEGVGFSASATYCTAEAQRASIINTYGWSIGDGGKSCPSAEVPDEPEISDTQNEPITDDNYVSEDPFPDLPGPEGPDITELPAANNQEAPRQSTSPLASSPLAVAASNTLFALAKRIPEPITIGFPWLLLTLALVLVSIQYYQVHSESRATKRMQSTLANQQRLVEEQNNFVALSTHYLHTPLTVMEGEITLMVKAGTLTQEQATKLKATLASLNAEAEATLAEKENNERNS